MPRAVMALALLASVFATTAPASARIAMDPVRVVVRGARPRIASCMARCVGCTADRYRLVATITIEMDGSVSAADAETSLPDGAVVQCIVGVIASLRFPAHPGGGSGPGPIRVVYPFVLEMPRGVGTDR